jgi:hypothetical protein
MAECKTLARRCKKADKAEGGELVKGNDTQSFML